MTTLNKRSLIHFPVKARLVAQGRTIPFFGKTLT